MPTLKDALMRATVALQCYTSNPRPINHMTSPLVAISLFAVVSLTACDGGGGGRPNPSPLTTVSGVVQKGPFLSGSTIGVQILDASMNPTGTSFNTTTTNNGGSFSAISVPRNSTIQVIGTGFYFDEINNRLSSSQITINSLARASRNSQSVVNVNILTALTAQRIRALVMNGSTFAAAKSQAESEALVPFRVGASFSGFETLDMTNGTANDSKLLAVAAIIQQAASNSAATVAQVDASLTQLISQFASDLADNGVVSAGPLLNKIEDAINTVQPITVKGNLDAYYQGIGISASVPSFSESINPSVTLPAGFLASEAVDTGNFSSIVVTADGVPHIFYAQGSTALKHAYKVGGIWTIETVGTVLGGIASPISAKVDSAGYIKGIAGGVYFTNENADASWTVLPLNGAYASASLAISADGTVGTSFINQSVSPNTINYATLDSSGVATGQFSASTALQLVDSTISQTTCMTYDKNSIPHIFWIDRGTLTPGLRHATNSSGQWVITNLETQNHAGEACAALVDSTGYIRVAYTVGDGANRAIWLGTLAANGWSSVNSNVNLAPVSLQSSQATMTISPVLLNSNVLGFVSGTANSLEFYSRLLTMTAARTISGNPSVYSSAIRDSTTGKVHVSFTDNGSGKLNYAVSR